MFHEVDDARTPCTVTLDASTQRFTKFSVPTAVKSVSLTEAARLGAEDSAAAGRMARNLVVSGEGAVTLWQSEISRSHVFFFVAKGARVFYFVRPTTKNLALFDAFEKLGDKRLFFGSHPELEGGCQKLLVPERHAVVMPAGFIYCAMSISNSVTLG